MNGSRRAAVLGMLIASLAACRVGPNYYTPALPTGAEAPLVSVNVGAETPTESPDAWWHLYSDTRLDALAQEALRANRTLAAADANFAAARAVVSAVHAGRYPSTAVSAVGLYGRDATTDQILELTGRPPQTAWVFEDIFQAAYELDLFGRVHRAIEAANANADAVASIRDGVRVARCAPGGTAPGGRNGRNGCGDSRCSAIWTCSRRNNLWSRSTPRSLHPTPSWCKTRLPCSGRWAADGAVKVHH